MITHAEEGYGLRRGDEVKVVNSGGNKLRGTFRVIDVCSNDLGETWVDVFGGPVRRQQYRSFALSRVEKVEPNVKTPRQPKSKSTQSTQ